MRQWEQVSESTRIYTGQTFTPDSLFSAEPLSTQTHVGSLDRSKTLKYIGMLKWNFKWIIKPKYLISLQPTFYTNYKCQSVELIYTNLKPFS